MPFGYNCEYPDFDACVKAQMKAGHNKISAQKICGSIKNKTEEKCRKRKSKGDKKK